MQSLWEDVYPGKIHVGDILRVKLDAYSTDAGRLHNGRLVVVTEVNGGDVYVKTIDYKQPYIKLARHSPYKLEKRKKEDGDNKKVD